MIGIGIANSCGLGKPGSVTIDPSAEAFIIAAGITDPTQQSAINSLVIGLKTDSIWDKMKAIYPFVGGTATTHKFNLKDPRDLDAAFRLVFTGGWTHNVNGVTPNGVNAYADTKYVPSVNNVVSDYSSLSIYSRTNSISVSPDIQIDMGVNQFSTPTGAFMLFTGYNSVNQLAGFQSDFPNAFTYGFYGSQGANTNTTGFYTGTANSVNNQVYKNGTLITQNTFAKVTTRTSPTIALFIGADNYNNNARRYSLKNYAFAHIGKSLTSTDISNLNRIVQAFQTALSRQV
jgi:hypothetical protein